MTMTDIAVTTNNKQQTTNNKQQPTNNKQQPTNNKQQTTTKTTKSAGDRCLDHVACVFAKTKERRMDVVVC